jgi:hypothetical protein
MFNFRLKYVRSQIVNQQKNINVDILKRCNEIKGEGKYNSGNLSKAQSYPTISNTIENIVNVELVNKNCRQVTTFLLKMF